MHTPPPLAGLPTLASTHQAPATREQRKRAAEQMQQEAGRTKDLGGRFFRNLVRTTPTLPCERVTCHPSGRIVPQVRQVWS